MMVWIQDTPSCPEQWIIQDEKGNNIAFVRERHGNLSVGCPDYKGEVVLELIVKDGKSVKDYVDDIEDAITEYLHRDRNN